MSPKSFLTLSSESGKRNKNYYFFVQFNQNSKVIILIAPASEMDGECRSGLMGTARMQRNPAIL
jgi:hypothetical protein